jgi:predicted restriction endonuclease
MSGTAEPRLLIASHIVSCNQDKASRLNPGSGLCLSALHERAFDQHLIRLTDSARTWSVTLSNDGATNS